MRRPGRGEVAPDIGRERERVQRDERDGSRTRREGKEGAGREEGEVGLIESLMSS